MPEARAALLGSEQLCEEYGSLHSTRNVAPELWPPPADCVGRKKEMKAELGSAAGPRIAQQSQLESAQALLVWSSPPFLHPQPASSVTLPLGGASEELGGSPTWGTGEAGVTMEVRWEHQYMITTHP